MVLCTGYDVYYCSVPPHRGVGGPSVRDYSLPRLVMPQVHQGKSSEQQLILIPCEWPILHDTLTRPLVGGPGILRNVRAVSTVYTYTNNELSRCQVCSSWDPSRQAGAGEGQPP